MKLHKPYRIFQRFVLIVLLLVTFGCKKVAPLPIQQGLLDAGPSGIVLHHTVWNPQLRDRVIAEGREVLTRVECNRCHVIDEIPPAGRSLHCQSCHEWLGGLAPGSRQWTTLVSRYGEDVIRRYQRNMKHYLRIPSLTNIGRRLRPAWIASYVQAPFDVRPMLDETMVRTRVSERDARVIARYFAAIAEVEDPEQTSTQHPTRQEISPARVAEGARLFQQYACGNCHTLGNVPTGRSLSDLTQAGVAAAMAPNLRFARERIEPDVIVDWLLHPEQISPGTMMPNLGLTRAQAEVLRDYIVSVDPQLQPTPQAPSTVPVAPVSRSVSWEEVKEQVLGFVCVHCHMNDHERDPGPGNRGGFGYPGSQLQMRTYETLVSGAVDPNGVRYSVLVPRDNETVPPLIASMMRRRFEELRDHVPALRDHQHPSYINGLAPGMPMGLPSITDEQIALVSAWIAQGCPGPREITGMPGIRDGFLVPDGPIEPNHGCQLRPLMNPRPAWASQPPPPWERPRQP